MGFAALVLLGCGSDSSDDNSLPSNQAQTEQGLVEGVEDENTGIVVFKGIPYAAPPTGDNRFRPPAAPANRSELLLATDYGNNCAQAGGSFGSASVSEDCLYLNVFTPDTTGDFPVMVWIHGGAFVVGSGNEPENNNPDYQPTYDPNALVEQGVVVVTLNYRLGILGFLAHPVLSAESGMGSGNYGIMDQQAALAWVQSNIEAFGGDPSNVTIFGESAGGHSVMTQLVSSKAQGLFHKAIVQSGSYAPNQLSLPVAEAIGAATATALGCDSAGDSAACLRGLPVEAILAAQGPAYLPAVDGNVLTHSITAALETSEGFVNQVPVMTGFNLHEGRLFTALDELNAFLSTGPEAALDLYDSDQDYKAAVQLLLSEDPTIIDAQAIAAAYLNDYSDADPHRYRLALSEIKTDWRFACNALRQFSQLTNKGITTYAYHFADANAPALLASVSGFPLGAAHAFEIQYVLGNDGQRQARAGEGVDISAQTALASTMVRYWSEFAKTGSPNNSADPAWSEFGSGEGVISLAESIGQQSAATLAEMHHCERY